MASKCARNRSGGIHARPPNRHICPRNRYPSPPRFARGWGIVVVFMRLGYTQKALQQAQRHSDRDIPKSASFRCGTDQPQSHAVGCIVLVHLQQQTTRVSLTSVIRPLVIQRLIAFELEHRALERTLLVVYLIFPHPIRGLTYGEVIQVQALLYALQIHRTPNCLISEMMAT